MGEKETISILIDELIAKWEKQIAASNNSEIQFKFTDFNQGNKVGNVQRFILCLSDLKELRLKLNKP